MPPALFCEHEDGVYESHKTLDDLYSCVAVILCMFLLLLLLPIQLRFFVIVVFVVDVSETDG